MGITQRIAVTAAAAALSAALASCSGAGLSGPPQPGQPGPGHGPAVILRVAVYGSPGYRQAGLFADYQRLHPGIRIVENAVGTEAAYWQALRRQLAAGRGPGDLMAIPLARMGDVLRHYRPALVPLSTLGGVGGGVNTFVDQWLPWIWRPAYHSGQAYAIGAETGPLGLCYRPRLLAEAGLPSSPARLARAWSTWQGYLAFGREFRQRIPHGPAFMDSAAGVYDAMISQSGAATRQAWDSAALAAKDGLSAGLTPQTPAWDTGVTRLSFATAVCPPWLLNPIQRLSGARGTGTWAVTTVPGGTGDWGGFYLAIPRTSAHQQDAYQLAVYLSGQQAGLALAQTGAFPASSPAINAAAPTTNPYFSNSPVGQIFARAATRMPPAAPATMSALVPAELAQVQSGHQTPAQAWARLRHATTP